MAAHHDAYRQVDELLLGLVNRTEVRYGMLVDHNGQVLSSQGNEAGFLAETDEVKAGATVESIGTLVANNASATSALAQFLGEDTFGEQLFHGKRGTLYVESVGHSALLTLVFDRTVPTSKVRIYAKRTVQQINAMLEEIQRLPEPQLADGFAQGAMAFLDDLLG